MREGGKERESEVAAAAPIGGIERVRRSETEKSGCEGGNLTWAKIAAAVAFTFRF